MSAVLRAMLTSQPPLVVDDAFIERRATLEARRAARHAAERALTESSQLTWAQLAGALADKPIPTVRAMRGKFKKLLRIVSTEVVGPEASPDELYSALAEAMPLLASGTRESMAELRRTVGEYEQSPSITDACKLAAELQQWRTDNADAINQDPTAVAATGAIGSAAVAAQARATAPVESSMLCRESEEYGAELDVPAASFDDYADEELAYALPTGVAGSVRDAPAQSGHTTAGSAASTGGRSSGGAPSDAAPSAVSSLEETGVVDERWLIMRCEQFLAANPHCVFDVASLAAEVVGVLKTRREVRGAQPAWTWAARVHALHAVVRRA